MSGQTEPLDVELAASGFKKEHADALDRWIAEQRGLEADRSADDDDTGEDDVSTSEDEDDDVSKSDDADVSVSEDQEDKEEDVSRSEDNVSVATAGRATDVSADADVSSRAASDQPASTRPVCIVGTDGRQQVQSDSGTGWHDATSGNEAGRQHPATDVAQHISSLDLIAGNESSVR